MTTTFMLESKNLLKPRKRTELATAPVQDSPSNHHTTVAAHLRGMRLASTNIKDTLMLRIYSKHQYFYSNSKIFYNYCTYKRIPIE